MCAPRTLKIFKSKLLILQSAFLFDPVSFCLPCSMFMLLRHRCTGRTFSTGCIPDCSWLCSPLFLFDAGVFLSPISMFMLLRHRCTRRTFSTGCIPDCSWFCSLLFCLIQCLFVSHVQCLCFFAIDAQEEPPVLDVSHIAVNDTTSVAVEEGESLSKPLSKRKIAAAPAAPAYRGKYCMYSVANSVGEQGIWLQESCPQYVYLLWLLKEQVFVTVL